MISMRRHELVRDRLLRLQFQAAPSNARRARGLRSRRRMTPTLTGGRLRTGGFNTRFLSPVAFDTNDFSIRRGMADAGPDGPSRITYPTAGVEWSGGSPDLRPRRPVN